MLSKEIEEKLLNTKKLIDFDFIIQEQAIKGAELSPRIIKHYESLFPPDGGDDEEIGYGEELLPYYPEGDK